MAICRKLNPPPAPPPTYNLELSQAEVEFLADLLSNGVSGSSATSRRGLSDNILVALADAGIEPDNDAEDMTGEVRCV